MHLDMRGEPLDNLDTPETQSDTPGGQEKRRNRDFQAAADATEIPAPHPGHEARFRRAAATAGVVRRCAEPNAERKHEELNAADRPRLYHPRHRREPMPGKGIALPSP